MYKKIETIVSYIIKVSSAILQFSCIFWICFQGSHVCRFLINNVSNLSNVAKVNGLAFTLRGNPFLHVGGAKKSWNLREFHAFGVFQRSFVSRHLCPVRMKGNVGNGPSIENTLRKKRPMAFVSLVSSISLCFPLNIFKQILE